MSVLALVATIIGALTWRGLRRRWRGENPGRLGQAVTRIEQDKWLSAAAVALGLSTIGIILKWPFGHGVVGGIILAVCAFAVLTWALAARADRPTR